MKGIKRNIFRNIDFAMVIPVSILTTVSLLILFVIVMAMIDSKVPTPKNTMILREGDTVIIKYKK